MIFKTFDSNIDKISSKWGIFGRSFNDIGTAIVGRITDIGKAFQATDDLVSSIKDSDSIWKRLYPSRESIKAQLIDVDALYPDKSNSQFSSILSTLVGIDEQVKSGVGNWQDYFNDFGEAEKWQIEFVQNTNLQKASLSDVKKAYDSARASALAHNEAIKAQTFSAKAGKVALQALVTVGNMFLMWAISKGLEFAVKGIDNLIHSAEKCKERVDELMSSYQSALSEANNNAQTVEELADKYEKLSKGVNNLGENVSLTTDEYAEYNKIVNQIADMFPNLIQGYTNEGNAILSLKGNVEELRDAYKAAQQEAYNMLIVSGKDSDGNDIVENFQNTWGSKSFFNDIFKGSLSAKEHADIITSLYDAMLKSDEAYEKLYKDLIKGSGLWNNYHLTGFQANDIKKTLKEIGFTSELSDEDKHNIANNARSYIQTYQAEVDSALKNVQTLANAYLMTNEDYAFLDEQSQNAASIIVNSINENIASEFEKKEDVGAYVTNVVDALKDNPEVRNALVGLFTLDLSKLSPTQAKELVDQYIKCIAKALGEDDLLELKIRFGFEDTDTIARNYNAVMRSAAIKFSGLNIQHDDNNNEVPTALTSDRRIAIDSVEAFQQEKAALEAFAEENSINTQDEIAFWNQCIEESETKEEAMEKYLASAFTNLEDDTLVPTISSSISQIATQLEPQFTELGKLYNEIFQTDDNGNEIFSLDSIDNAALESLRKSFAEIGEEIGVTFDPAQLEPFFTILMDGSSTADEVQQAFNDLAAAYLYSTDTLEQLNDETAGAIEKQLAEMGVTNAHEVVLNALSEAKLRAVLAGYDLSGASLEAMAAILNEGQAAGITEQMVYALTAAEIAYGDNDLSTEEKIDKLKTLAQAYGDVTTSALATAIANDLASGAEIDPETALAELMNNFGKYKVDIDFSPFEKSISGASSSATTQAETDWKNLLDKETDLLEKQLAANLIAFQEYMVKRRQIIEDYYRDGRISAEEYYDALESMYGSQLSLYDKAVNAVTGSIDDEIEKLDEQKEAIENFYQVKIDAIQEEIDALNKANDARKAQIDLEKAQYEAERARNQHVNKVYDGSQFVYSADMEAVRDAEENLADQKTQISISRLEAQIESLEKEMKNATKGLDSQIEALESYKEKWNEISGVYEEQQNKLIAAEILGADWESQVLNGRLDTLRNFTEQYISLQQAQADAAANAARIKAEAAAGNATGGNVGTTPATQSLRQTSAGDGNDAREESAQRKKLPANTANDTMAGFNISSQIRATMARFHGGLDEGYATAPGQSTPANRSLSLLQKLAGENLLPNELPAILQHGELVITPEQQRNIIANTQRYCSLSSANRGYASPYSGEASQIHIDSLTISCPNVTNNSGAEYILKSLERLPLDNIQHSHRRRY